MRENKVNADGLTEAEFLAAYKPGDYERPSVTVDMMVLRMKEDLSGLQILLIQRKNHPCIDCWALPGGFVDMTESTYEAAVRELKEETHFDATDVYMEQLYTMSQPDRDPRMRIIDVAYIAMLPYGHKSEVAAGDDAKSAVWFDVDFDGCSRMRLSDGTGVSLEYDVVKKTFRNGKLKIESYIPVLSNNSTDVLAFDHSEIILEGLRRIQNKVEYTDIIFNLVPDEFTLPDLQRVYETLMCKALYKSNFRDKIIHKIIESGNKSKPMSSNRMAKLYVYNGGVK